MRRRLRFAPVAVLVVAAGCSSSDEAAPAVNLGLDEATVIAADEGVDLLTVTAFGSSASWTERVQAAKTATADCMRGRGWRDFEPIQGPVSLATPEMSRSYSSEYGYGVSTDFGGSPTSSGEHEDVNAELLAAMDQSERQRYDAALWGADGVGCFEIGHDAAFGNTLAFTEEFRNLQSRTAALMESDRRVIAAEEAFASCMNDEGWEFRSEDEVVGELILRLDAVSNGRPPEAIAETDPGLRSLRQFELSVSSAANRCLDVAQLPQTQNEVLTEIQLGEADSCPDCWNRQQ